MPDHISWSTIANKVLIPVVAFFLIVTYNQVRESNEKLNLLLQKDAAKDVLIERILKQSEDHEKRIREIESK